MRDIKLTEPITVTLRAADWFWVLGLLSSVANHGENQALDKLYDQILDVTE